VPVNVVVVGSVVVTEAAVVVTVPVVVGGAVAVVGGAIVEVGTVASGALLQAVTRVRATRGATNFPMEYRPTAGVTFPN